MAQPAPAQQQPTQQQDQQLGLAVASVLVTAVSVAAATAALGPVFVAAGIKRAALRQALDIVMNFQPAQTGFWGPATQQMARVNLIRRAQFVVHSSRRFAADQRLILAGMDIGSIQDTMTRERRYYAQHMQAIWQREMAAARVDSASMLYGRLLGWYTRLDGRETADCHAANGRNFYADMMPTIGYPGTVHSNCRCLPGQPWDTRAMVGQPPLAGFRYTFGKPKAHAHV
jgi:hypothetical protein